MKRIAAASLALVLCAAWIMGVSSATAQTLNQSSPSQKKRAEPVAVDPVVIDGIRYEAPLDGKAHGLGQNGGYIVARDDRTGAPLWMLKVYDIVYAANREGDKQDVFITEMKPGPGSGMLQVTDELGRHWRIDLVRRQVSREVG